jgi:ketosteroid isomerase-like protein
MSRENVEIMRRAYDAVNRRDWAEAFRDAAADFRMTTQRGPDAGTHQGRDRVIDFAEDYIGAFDKFVWEIEQVFEGGDRVVVFVRVRSLPKGGGVDLVVRNGHCWTVRDGVIVAMESFPEPERALEAAGLRE